MCGCSATIPKPAVVTAVDEVSPLILTIEEEYRNNDQLTIQGRLTSRGDWSEDSVAIVRLISLNGGEVIGEALYPLQGTSLSEDESHSFTISVSAGNITDYQLSLLWGNDAKLMLSKMTPAAKPEEPVIEGTLVLSEIETAQTPMQCKLGDANCEGGIDITATLNNQSSLSVRNIIVGVKLVSDSGELYAPEEIHELEGVVIPPMSKRPLEIGIAIPAGISSADVTANLRLVDFKHENQQQ